MSRLLPPAWYLIKLVTCLWPVPQLKMEPYVSFASSRLEKDAGPPCFLSRFFFPPWILSSTASSMVTICVGIATAKRVCLDADVEDGRGHVVLVADYLLFLGRWPVTCCAESSGSCTWARGCRGSCRGAAGRSPRPRRASVSSVRTRSCSICSHLTNWDFHQTATFLCPLWPVALLDLRWSLLRLVLLSSSLVVLLCRELPHPVDRASIILTWSLEDLLLPAVVPARYHHRCCFCWPGYVRVNSWRNKEAELQ